MSTKLALTVALLVACGGDDGDSGPGPGADGGGPVPVACGPEHLDLASMSGAGVTKIDIGYTLDDSASIGGETLDAARFNWCLPDDTVSAVIMARPPREGAAAVAVARYDAGDENLVDLSDTESFLASRLHPTPMVDGKLASFDLLAAGPVSGAVSLTLVGEAHSSGELEIHLRRGQAPAQASLTLNVVFVAGTSLSVDEANELIVESDIFDQILAQANITIDHVGFGAIESSNYAVWTNSRAQIEAIEAEPIVELVPELPFIEGGATLFVVDTLDTPSGCPDGVSTGIPGVVGAPYMPGMFMAIDGLRVPGGINNQIFWLVAAHELGHWLGLFHTSEFLGTLHDPFADTPECGLARDANGDGGIESDECFGAGADHLMFPTVIDARISGSQVQRLRAATLFAN